MKTRTGFVSNSSSSSFVCLAINLDDYPELKEKFYDPEDYSETPKNKQLLPKGTSCIHYEGEGTMLGLHLGGGDTSCGDFGVTTKDWDELNAYANALAVVTGVKPKLCGGCYPC